VCDSQCVCVSLLVCVTLSVCVSLSLSVCFSYVIGGGVVPGLSVSGLNESYYNPNYIPEFSLTSIVVLSAGMGMMIYLFRRKIINLL